MSPEVVVEGWGLGLRQTGVFEAAEDLVEDVELVAVLLLQLAVAAGEGGVRVGVGGGGGQVPRRRRRRRHAAAAVGGGVLHRH